MPLQRRITDFFAERGNRKTILAIKEHYGIEMTVRTVGLDIADKAKAFNVTDPAGLENQASSERLVAQVDGSMLPILHFADPPQPTPAQDSETPASIDKRKLRRGHWKEIRVCTVSDPRLTTSWYGVSRGTPLEVGCMIHDTCRFGGMNHATRIHAVSDGAPWIADQFEKQFGMQHRFLLDFYHVCEYLAKASGELYKKKSASKEWYDEQKQKLLKGEEKEVLISLGRACHSDPQSNAPKAEVRKCLNYLAKRRDQLDYAGTLAQDLPIGSGEVESAHRHLLQQRLKIPGAWWLLENAEKVSHLRATRANNRWEEFWKTQLN